ILVNISQCPGGTVVQGKYETSKSLAEIGVLSGEDMTMEAGVTKLMILLGEQGVESTRKNFKQPLAGEVG
ncbi:MAG: L-asparaginase 1, partial [Cyclobacteriaceae bacterium]|nr:L-asparaginase 1 [Cyclobacteriaceae bacterium]